MQSVLHANDVCYTIDTKVHLEVFAVPKLEVSVPSIIKSIRSSILGEISDFVSEAGFGHAEINLLTDLVYELAEYREEGVSCYPTVYLVALEADSSTLAAIAPSADQIQFGKREHSDGAASVILKSTAPLAEGGWSIFIESDGTKYRYGIFRSEASPIAVSSSELFLDQTAEIGRAILLRNCSSRCVELLSGSGIRMEFSLTSAKPSEDTVSEAFTRLAEQATMDVGEHQRDATREYLRRLLFETSQQSHGTIVVVVPSTIDKMPDEFQDGIILEQEIDVPEALGAVQDQKSADSLASLLSREILLRKMVQSDGIMVLGSDGKVKAFRVFVKATDQERDDLAKLDIKGGARSRAHELLKLRLGEYMNCVCFSSQDGNTVCTVKQ